MTNTVNAENTPRPAANHIKQARQETIDLLLQAGAEVAVLKGQQIMLASLGDITLRVRDDGGLSFNALAVEPQHVAETVRLLAKVCHNPPSLRKLEDSQ